MNIPRLTALRPLLCASVLILSTAGWYADANADTGAASPATVAPGDPPGLHAVTTWAAGVQSTTGPTTGQTVRNIIHTSVGGVGLRLTLSNVEGDAPVVFDAAFVGIPAQGAALVAGSNRRLTFGGRSEVTIPPGAAVLSDPLPGRVPAGHDLAVSVHIAAMGQVATGHNMYRTQTSYLSTPGDHATDESPQAFTTPITRWFWLAAAQVDPVPQVGTLVAFGDSITDGYGSSVDANHRWPDFLAQRILAEPPPLQLGVANVGISGNELLRDGKGASALARFDRDVLDQPGVRTVILMEGGNDIGANNATAEQLIAGERELIARAHAYGVCILGATQTPMEGSGYYSAQHEAVRVEFNAWIRGSGEFDAVIDFDAVTRDPQRPTRFLPAFDGAGHLHPNDAGYQAMADAIPLSDLSCSR
ncbi:lysophospholipase L1-like esterase [Hamadaea flava]|uniref:SGNH/GDSL hydrolase family protein n=1 Tax=Hamadaea flava TaxID=1742688 RepID=A0ABV8LSS4_9ACTN|nr:SGNH/GDSL hydrolase family protein [Hamadaea flava]MCP2328717.1 lysophospholipase L1-like esterase [Hamadaea flava]